MSDVNETIARNIRSLRRAQGWSVRELAEECAKRGATELTHASLTNIERRDAKRPNRRVTVAELLVLADVFDVTPSELFDAPEWTPCGRCGGTGRVLRKRPKVVDPEPRPRTRW